jgi:repressor LexA
MMPEVSFDPQTIRNLIEHGLTDRQAGIFLYLFQFTLQNGYQPSIRELCDEFTISSPNGMMVHLKALARKGWISLSGGESRAVRFLRRPGGGKFVGLVEREE